MFSSRIHRRLALVLVAMTITAESQAAVPSGASPTAGRSETSSLPAADTSFQGSLGLTSLSYLTQPGVLKQSQFTIGRLNANYSRVGNELEIHAESRIGVGLDCGSQCSSVEFPQLSIGSSRRLGPVSFHLGRVLAPWSSLDDEWKLGVFQPRFIYDFLHPQQVGLIGGFLETRGSGWKLTGFAAPGFIPDRGLPVNVENGRIASIDPFFHAPISEVIYEGRNTPVTYNVSRPPLTDLLMKPAVGVLGQWGTPGQGWTVSGSYAYKPVNQVLLAYNNLYNLSFEVADADLYPRVVMHHVAAADLKYSRKRVSGGLFLVHEVPVMDSVPKEWTAQQLSSAWLVSPQFSVRGEKTFQFNASYLLVEGGNAADKKASGGPGVSDGVSVFEKRYPFSSALKLSATDQLWKRASKNLTWKSQILLDLEHSAQAILHSFAYQPDPSWQVKLSTDILVGTSSGSDFISRNRANDRVFGVVSYVF